VSARVGPYGRGMRVVSELSVPTSPTGPAHFTGLVWRTNFIEPASPDQLAGSRFMYEPGARSHWHVHEREQAIIAVYGCGVVAWEGLADPIQLRAGDWWRVEPGVPHWHGATAAAAFTHLAVTAGGATTWLHEVAEAEYRAAATT
jgi:quercetin dioxygenase-like cupin family protein